MIRYLFSADTATDTTTTNYDTTTATVTNSVSLTYDTKEYFLSNDFFYCYENSIEYKLEKLEEWRRSMLSKKVFYPTYHHVKKLDKQSYRRH